MYKTLVPYLALLLSGALGHNDASASCKCVPGNDCWPTESLWHALNKDVGGKLIRTQPIAQACYPGPGEDLEDCGYIVTEWPDEDFQTSNPIGRVLPYNVTCPPVDYQIKEVPTACTTGINPIYAVNATTISAINSTIQFARKHNVRTVISGTGHDLLGRSDGYASLEVWLRYYRNSVNFQEAYKPVTRWNSSDWKGSAIHIDGVWQWRDVVKVAKARNVIVATGGSPSVGAIGGWPSGGGHGPATNFLGFGADQVLEAEVLLADGRVVAANPYQNADLFRALRGGGPGYGVVLSMTIKAHPNVQVVTAHHLSIVPLVATPDNSVLLDAVSVLLQQYPNLIDAGVGGYTYWFNHYPTVTVANSTSGYHHNVWTIGQDITAARAALQPVVDLLQQRFNSSLYIEQDYVTYSDYWSFYESEMALNDPEGKTLLVTSRLIERPQVANFTAVRDIVETISDTPPGHYNSQIVMLIGGGQVIKDGADPMTGLNPAWRRASYAISTVRFVPLHTTNDERQSISDDLLAKGAALQKFAPGTGAYINEADRNDPDYIENFYGGFYDSHLATKKKYDPENHFYCPTCVGSEAFVERSDGPLCLA